MYHEIIFTDLKKLFIAKITEHDIYVRISDIIMNNG